MHNPAEYGDADAPRAGPGDTAPLERPPATEALIRVVRDCLADLDELVNRYTGEVGQFAGYQETVPHEDLRSTAHTSLELLLRLIGDLPLPQRLHGISADLGRRRVHQNVPLEELLQAVRTDFRLLWTAMLERIPPEELPALTRGAVRVWEAVEFHTVRVHTAYLDETAVLAQARERERAALVGRLLASDGRDQQLVAQVGTALRVPPEATFTVAVARLPQQQQRLRAAATAAPAAAFAHVQEHGGETVLLALRSGASQLAATPGGAAPPRWLEGVPCALGPVSAGLARVPRALRAAETVAATLDDTTTGPVTLRDAWAPVVATRMGELGPVLAHELAGALQDIPTHERQRLVSTFTIYTRTGSVSETAGEMYCHRNTVLNRLNRLAELTGCRITSPAEAAALLLALHCEAEEVQ